MYYKYRLSYRHPHSGVAGLAMLPSAGEIVIERARLEALGYIVTEVLLPLGSDIEVPPASGSGSPPK